MIYKDVIKMKKEKLRSKSICYLIFLVILLLLGAIITFILNNYDCKTACLSECNKKNLITIVWIVIVIFICFLSRTWALFIFHEFEKMKNYRKYAEKNLPRMISIILGLYFISLPVLIGIGFDFSCYVNYVTVLTSILGLNGLITYFIAENSSKNSRETTAQQKNNPSTDGKLYGFRIEINKASFYGKRFKVISGILLVANYLGNGSGDNLWFEMNKWYEQYGNKKDDYPLFNARANNWQGNEVWYRQLNDFVNYLKQNNALDEDDSSDQKQ